MRQSQRCVAGLLVGLPLFCGCTPYRYYTYGIWHGQSFIVTPEEADAAYQAAREKDSPPTPSVPGSRIAPPEWTGAT